MTDILHIAQARIKAIDFEIATLANEQQELETFIRVYGSLLPNEKAVAEPPAGDRVAPSPAPNLEIKPAPSGLAAVPEGVSQLDQNSSSDSDHATDKSGEGAGASSPAPTLKKLVASVMEAHPDWASAKIASAIGKPKASVAATMSALRTEQRLRDAQRQPAPRRYPAGARFQLRDQAGLYLHYSCTVMTSDKAYAWQGTTDQLLACRQKFDLARDLAEHVVEKEQARAA